MKPPKKKTKPKGKSPFGKGNIGRQMAGAIQQPPQQSVGMPRAGGGGMGNMPMMGT
jgi:hypothetical protein